MILGEKLGCTATFSEDIYIEDSNINSEILAVGNYTHLVKKELERRYNSWGCTR